MCQLILISSFRKSCQPQSVWTAAGRTKQTVVSNCRHSRQWNLFILLQLFFGLSLGLLECFFFPTIYRHVTIRHQASARPLQSTASSVEVRGSTSRTEWLSPSTRPPTHLGLLYLSVLPAVLRSEVQNFVARINFWGGLKICFIIVIILIK